MVSFISKFLHRLNYDSLLDTRKDKLFHFFPTIFLHFFYADTQFFLFTTPKYVLRHI